jgi:hypothetical protein
MQSSHHSCQNLVELEFSGHIFEKSNFKFIRPVGAELIHADGRTDGRTETRTDGKTDIMKLIVSSVNFANAPKNWKEENI